MKFEEVLPLLREGKNVRRQVWALNKSISFTSGDGGIGFYAWRGSVNTFSYIVLKGEDIMADDWKEFIPGFEPEQTMIKLSGSSGSFRCECGCNVFTKDGPSHYMCNSCNAGYTGVEI